MTLRAQLTPARNGRQLLEREHTVLTLDNRGIDAHYTITSWRTGRELLHRTVYFAPWIDHTTIGFNCRCAGQWCNHVQSGCWKYPRWWVSFAGFQSRLCVDCLANIQAHVDGVSYRDMVNTHK